MVRTTGRDAPKQGPSCKKDTTLRLGKVNQLTDGQSEKFLRPSKEGHSRLGQGRIFGQATGRVAEKKPH